MKQTSDVTDLNQSRDYTAVFVVAVAAAAVVARDETDSDNDVPVLRGASPSLSSLFVPCNDVNVFLI